MNLTPSVLDQVLKVAAVLVIAILVAFQFRENVRLRKELALSKSVEKPQVKLTMGIDDDDQIVYYIYWIAKNMYWSSAGFNPNQSDARKFKERGHARTFAENMNCIVVN